MRNTKTHSKTDWDLIVKFQVIGEDLSLVLPDSTPFGIPVVAPAKESGHERCEATH